MSNGTESKGNSEAAESEGEFRFSDDSGTALVDGLTFASKPMVYVVVDGQAVVEGDILLGPVEEVREHTDMRRAQLTGSPVAHGVVISGSQYRWPDCTVPYVIGEDLSDPDRVTDAIAHWQANTNFTFVQRTPANEAQYPDYVDFVTGNGCASFVGRQGGRQVVTLSPNCSTGNTIHEIGHVVGMWHEQSREDRDAFVEINFANIIPAAINNFSQHITDGEDIGAYDYGSIMHYPRKAFSKNGQDTIVPTDPNAVIGQRDGLSAGDIASANAVCDIPVPTTVTRPTLTRQTFTPPTFTRPTLTRPTITRPTFTRPTLTRPTITRPTFTRPTLTRPTLTRPTLTRPTVTGPTFTRPTITPPTFTRPTLTRPTMTRPTFTRPTLTRPTLTRPTLTRPTLTFTPPTFTIPGTIPRTTIPGTIPRTTIPGTIPRTTIPGTIGTFTPFGDSGYDAYGYGQHVAYDPYSDSGYGEEPRGYDADPYGYDVYGYEYVDPQAYDPYGYGTYDSGYGENLYGWSYADAGGYDPYGYGTSGYDSYGYGEDPYGYEASLYDPYAGYGEDPYGYEASLYDPYAGYGGGYDYGYDDWSGYDPYGGGGQHPWGAV